MLAQAAIRKTSWHESGPAAAVFACLLGGAFGLHAAFSNLGSTVGGAYLATVVALALLSLTAATQVPTPAHFRWPSLALAAFGLLPFCHLVVVALTAGAQMGIFSYVYKFSPYLSVFYWVSVARRSNGRAIAIAVKVFACVVSLRQLAVFFFPEALGHRLSASVYDATYVYSYVGDTPRVFGPGAMILSLAAVLYAGDWIQGRLSPKGLLAFVFSLAASATTLTRGTTLAQMGLIGLVLIIGSRYRTGIARLLSALAGILTLATLLTAVVLIQSGSLEAYVPGSGDRLSLDGKTFDWRYAQVERAFIRNELTAKQWAVGVGPESFIQNDPNDRELLVNELHYSYLSILWTFGALGLALPLFVIAGVLFHGWREAVRRRQVLVWYTGIWIFVLLGIYTPTFTQPDSALGLTLCIASVAGMSAKRPERSQNLRPAMAVARVGGYGY